MSDELTDAIVTNATGPAAAAGDEGSITQHKLADQIEVKKFIAGQNAMKGGSNRKHRGLRFGKFVPPGTS